MELAPIIVFAYNRPMHLLRTLDELAKNTLANQSVLYIYCDGAKENATTEQVQMIQKVRQIAHAATGFKELHVIEREGRETVVLLDNEMRIVKPVYDYLKFQRQRDSQEPKRT